VLATGVAVAALSGIGAGAASADDPTAVELVGNWFGTMDTPFGPVGVELQIGAPQNRRFEWLALENFGAVAGFMDVAMGDGTIAAMGQGEINRVGIPGNPAGLLRIEARTRWCRDRRVDDSGLHVPGKERRRLIDHRRAPARQGRTSSVNVGSCRARKLKRRREELWEFGSAPTRGISPSPTSRNR
jgi:hypothetical protein